MEWEERGVSWACRASQLCDRTFAREQHPGQDDSHAMAKPRLARVALVLLCWETLAIAQITKVNATITLSSFYKAKLTFCTQWWHRGSKAPLILNLGTLHPCHFTPRRRIDGTHWTEGRTGPRAGLDVSEERKNLSPIGYRRVIPWSPHTKIVHYTNWAIRRLILLLVYLMRWLYN